MIESRSAGAFEFDNSWGRLLWITPVALLCWTVLLAVFAILLERTASPPPELTPIRAQLVVETPASVAPKVAAPKPAPVFAPPRIAPNPRPLHRTKPHIFHPAPSPNGIAKTKKAEPPPTPPNSAATPAAGPAEETSGDTSGLSGAAKDNSGARAVFAPQPQIPDDLREEPINTVAVAHFVVDAQGNAQVALSQPTDNPELNAVLLETLRKWRFLPAMHDGAAIASQFDVRIPITVE
jgi:protein TonB